MLPPSSRPAHSPREVVVFEAAAATSVAYTYSASAGLPAGWGATDERADRPEALPGARHSYIRGPMGEGWQITNWLLVSETQEADGTFVVSSDLPIAYGSGPTPAEAMSDFLLTVRDLYLFAEADAAKNLRGARQQLAVLRHYISLPNWT
jgi:hypothetical protein